MASSPWSRCFDEPTSSAQPSDEGCRHGRGSAGTSSASPDSGQQGGISPPSAGTGNSLLQNRQTSMGHTPASPEAGPRARGVDPNLGHAPADANPRAGSAVPTPVR